MKLFIVIFTIIVNISINNTAFGFNFGKNGVSLNEFFEQCEFIMEKACEIYNLEQVQKENDLSKVTSSLSNSSLLNSLSLIEQKGKDWKNRSLIMFSMGIAFKIINMDDSSKFLINNSTDNDITKNNIEKIITTGFTNLTNVYSIFNKNNLIAGTPIAFINKLREYMINQDTDICQRYSGHETTTKKDLEILDNLNKSKQQLNELKK